MKTIVDTLEEIKELCEEMRTEKDCESCFYCMDGTCFFGSTIPREWETDELT